MILDIRGGYGLRCARRDVAITFGAMAFVAIHGAIWLTIATVVLRWVACGSYTLPGSGESASRVGGGPS